MPTAGCRVTDTRGTSKIGPRNTPLGADQSFMVSIHGSNGECTGALAIPADAVGVALNVTAVNATASSNIRVFPADLASVPKLSNLNVSAGAPPLPNKVDVKLSPAGKIKVYNFNGSVNIVIDIVGYYTSSSLKELAAGLDTANAKIAALESAITASDEQIAALERAQPFATMSETGGTLGLTDEASSVETVTITAPVDGQVTLNYSIGVKQSAAGTYVLCAPYRSTEIPWQIAPWNTPGQAFWIMASATANLSNLSGTRTFDISASQTVTYSVACQEVGGVGVVSRRTVTAIFTPAP